MSETRGASAEQRGEAAHARQEVDNTSRERVTREEYNFLNRVIHDKSMEYRPEFDKPLARITDKVFKRR
ncbi:hypothetical protein PAPYR_1578 [Paratrimastix pyriformis]|uniref:Uncharacterized protein n=1 Tax=Paratrimastix pyriformis TaxID=342808 RepID=A0ABQ8UTN1_9EUKA|nr:hypothetical protein PAPYR_1578 [Paratrimastix pyriformis]